MLPLPRRSAISRLSEMTVFPSCMHMMAINVGATATPPMTNNVAEVLEYCHRGVARASLRRKAIGGMSC
jgi:hypothetical protein